MVASASPAWARASASVSPNVCASGKSGKVTITVPLSSGSRTTGYRTICSSSARSFPEREKPAFQLVAGHETEATTELFKTQHICFRCITSVEGGAPHGIVADPGAAAQADAKLTHYRPT